MNDIAKYQQQFYKDDSRNPYSGKKIIYMSCS